MNYFWGIIVLAAVVRGAAYVLFNVFLFDDQFFHPDSYVYHYISLALREDWAAGELTLTYYPAYTNLTAVLYFLPGPDTFWPELLNMVASTATVAIGMMTVQRIAGSRAAVTITGLVLALDPYMVYLSTQYLRDSLILFATAFFIYGLVGMKTRVLLFVGILLGALRYLQLLVLSPLILIVRARGQWRARCLIIVVPLVLIMFVMPRVAPANLFNAVPIPPNATAGHEPHVEFFARHLGVKYKVVPYNDPSEWGRLIDPVFAFKGLGAFLFFPWPLDADTLIEAGFGAYMGYWYALLAIGGVGLLARPSVAPGKLYIIGGWALAAGVLLAMTTESQGPFIRWRMQLFYLMIPLLSIGVANMLSFEAKKRAFDLIVSGSAVVLLMPVWVSTAAVLAVTQRKVLFAQQRRGKDGGVFTVQKFVTMRPGSEGSPLVDEDPRVTRFGKVLRKTALDELPEILAILKGDMSIVGPRALAVWEDDECAASIEGWNQRYAVKPGLIGLAQLKTDRRDNVAKLACDIDYLRLRSFGYDLKLFLYGAIGNVTGRWK